MEPSDILGELLSLQDQTFHDMPRPLHSPTDSPRMHFFGNHPPLSSYISLPHSSSTLLDSSMKPRTSSTSFMGTERCLPGMKHEGDSRLFSFPQNNWPSSPSISSSPRSLGVKNIQNVAKESEVLSRNLEFQLQVNQLRHLQKLLNFQASMSYMQAMKIAAAANQTAALVATLDSSNHEKQPGIRPSIVQDHITNVSKQLEIVAQNSPSLSFNEDYFHPRSFLALEGEFKRLKEAAQSTMCHSSPGSESDDSFRASQRMDDSLKSFPAQTSPISPCQYPDFFPQTPVQNKEVKHLPRRISDLKPKGEKGLFFCEDPTCGAELRTRSGFRRHRQKHASGHVLRKRMRRYPGNHSFGIETSIKESESLATPAIVTQRQPSMGAPFDFPFPDNVLL